MKYNVVRDPAKDTFFNYSDLEIGEIYQISLWKSTYFIFLGYYNNNSYLVNPEIKLMFFNLNSQTTSFYTKEELRGCNFKHFKSELTIVE